MVNKPAATIRRSVPLNPRGGPQPEARGRLRMAPRPARGRTRTARQGQNQAEVHQGRCAAQRSQHQRWCPVVGGVPSRDGSVRARSSINGIVGAVVGR